MKKYQQGDVVLISIDKEEFEKSLNNGSYEKCLNGAKLIKGRHELAYGEETGHCHAIYHEDMDDSDAATLYKRSWARPDTPAEYVHVKEDVTITHEEHNPITIPAGFYRQRIVKEYDPLTGQVRGVID